jgi:hypothetical protein
MRKLVFASVATTAVLCAGSLSANRAEAMILGGDAAIRPTLQQVNPVDQAYYRRCWRGPYRWRCHRHYHRYWYR